MHTYISNYIFCLRLQMKETHKIYECDSSLSSEQLSELSVDPFGCIDE